MAEYAPGFPSPGALEKSPAQSRLARERLACCFFQED